MIVGGGTELHNILQRSWETGEVKKIEIGSGKERIGGVGGRTQSPVNLWRICHWEFREFFLQGSVSFGAKKNLEESQLWIWVRQGVKLPTSIIRRALSALLWPERGRAGATHSTTQLGGRPRSPSSYLGIEKMFLGLCFATTIGNVVDPIREQLYSPPLSRPRTWEGLTFLETANSPLLKGTILLQRLEAL